MTPKEIRSRRLALGLSVDEFAREVRLRGSEVREIEAGERAAPGSMVFEETFARLEEARRGSNA